MTHPPGPMSGGLSNNHSTNVEYPPPPYTPLVCMSIHFSLEISPAGWSDIDRVLVLNDPALGDLCAALLLAWSAKKPTSQSHAPLAPPISPPANHTPLLRHLSAHQPIKRRSDATYHLTSQSHAPHAPPVSPPPKHTPGTRHLSAHHPITRPSRATCQPTHYPQVAPGAQHDHHGWNHRIRSVISGHNSRTSILH